ncbi:MAG: SIS domain-containing protein [Cyanobacteria bacterium SIG29]|nr:SIS domain-containing protein [Cyanobacteria bacterium SIG29]
MIENLKRFFSGEKQTNMEKEIFEQPAIIKNLLKKYVDKTGDINIELPNNIKRITLIASGSSFHSADVAASFIRENSDCFAQAFYASEFSLLQKVNVDNETLYVFISQSGETSDTNKALDLVRSKTENTLSITNCKNSSLYNNTKYKILVMAGEEKAIASTKALSAQIFCLYLLALKLMQQKQISVQNFIDELSNVPNSIEKAFANREIIKNFAQKLSTYDNAAVIGTGMFNALAKEAALKVKETSYVNTTSYPTGEFLHGHIAILNKKCAVLAIVNNINVDFSKIVLDKIRASYKPDELIVSALPIDAVNSEVVVNLDINKDIEFLFASLVVFQLLAFETATALGRDIDSPTGLTKVVK